MKHNETLVDVNPFEIIVSYSSSWHDDGSGKEMRYTDIDRLEIVVKGEGFDLKKLIDRLPHDRAERVWKSIINELNYE